jgi:hypothetical protein
LDQAQNVLEEDTVSAALARILLRALAASVTGIDMFVQVALFSGIGLLLSFDSRSKYSRRMVLRF